MQDSRFAEDVTSLFERHFARSVEITAASWQSWSVLQRYREWAYGMLDSLVTRLR